MERSLASEVVPSMETWPGCLVPAVVVVPKLLGVVLRSSEDAEAAMGRALAPPPCSESSNDQQAAQTMQTTRSVSCSAP